MIAFNVTERGNNIELSLKKTKTYLLQRKYMPYLEREARRGIAALKEATPKDTGLTSESWTYEIEIDSAGIKIIWSNSNVQKDWFNVAVGLQYGHGTRDGHFIEGIDYINPALRPIFNDIAKTLWREVTS